MKCIFVFLMVMGSFDSSVSYASEESYQEPLFTVVALGIEEDEDILSYLQGFDSLLDDFICNVQKYFELRRDYSDAPVGTRVYACDGATLLFEKSL